MPRVGSHRLVRSAGHDRHPCRHGVGSAGVGQPGRSVLRRDRGSGRAGFLTVEAPGAWSLRREAQATTTVATTTLPPTTTAARATTTTTAAPRNRQTTAGNHPSSPSVQPLTEGVGTMNITPRASRPRCARCAVVAAGDVRRDGRRARPTGSPAPETRFSVSPTAPAAGGTVTSSGRWLTLEYGRNAYTVGMAGTASTASAALLAIARSQSGDRSSSKTTPSASPTTAGGR